MYVYIMSRSPFDFLSRTTPHGLPLNPKLVRNTGPAVTFYSFLGVYFEEESTSKGYPYCNMVAGLPRAREGRKSKQKSAYRVGSGYRA